MKQKRSIIPVGRKKDGRITARTKDDFLFWVKKQKALKKHRLEQMMDAQALAAWADDGGAMQTVCLTTAAELARRK